jgi:hypothetical protein
MNSASGTYVTASVARGNELPWSGPVPALRVDHPVGVIRDGGPAAHPPRWTDTCLCCQWFNMLIGACQAWSFGFPAKHSLRLQILRCRHEGCDAMIKVCSVFCPAHDGPHPDDLTSEEVSDLAARGWYDDQCEDDGEF